MGKSDRLLVLVFDYLCLFCLYFAVIIGRWEKERRSRSAYRLEELYFYLYFKSYLYLAAERELGTKEKTGQGLLAISV